VAPSGAKGMSALYVGLVAVGEARAGETHGARAPIVHGTDTSKVTLR
jgi:hypothetical protein